MYLGSVSAVPDKQTEDSSMTHCPVSRTVFTGSRDNPPILTHRPTSSILPTITVFQWTNGGACDAMYLGSVSAVPDKQTEDSSMTHCPVSRTVFTGSRDNPPISTHRPTSSILPTITVFQWTNGGACDAMYLGSVSAVPDKQTEDSSMTHCPVSRTVFTGSRDNPPISTHRPTSSILPTITVFQWTNGGACDAMYLGSVSAVPDKQTEDSSMTHCPVSRTLSFLGVAILVHLIVITSLADRGPSEDSQDELPRSKRSVETKRHRNAENAVASSQDAAAHGSVFATENSTVVTAQVASTATLPCTVRKFGTGVVSWIRRKDFQLLTVGLATYSSDDRFMVEHARHLQNWGLQIHKVQKTDAGMYECQVSTHPPTSIFVELKVIEAVADILGSPDLHIKSGSQLRLVCTLRHSTEAPVYVFWYHGDRMINYDKERGVTVRSDRKSSVLAINTADKSDSGNYTCVPSNAKAATINVHVLNGTVDGEKPAAMQHGGRNGAAQLTTAAVLLAICVASLVR